MALQKIVCACWSGEGYSRKMMTVREIVQERNRLRGIAFQYLKEHADDPNCKHIIYYRDRRNEVDDIWQVHFYYAMRPYTDEEFYQLTEDLDGFIGAVHRH